MQILSNPNEDYEYINKKSRKPKIEVSPRLIGFVFLIGGLVLGYIYIYEPIQGMAHHLKNVDYSIKAILCCSMLLTFGLFSLLAPVSLVRKVVEPGGKSKWLWIVFVIMLVVCALLYFLLKYQAEQYGYFIL